MSHLKRKAYSVVKIRQFVNALKKVSMNNQKQDLPREVTIMVDESGSIEKVASELKKLGVENVQPLENIGCITGQWTGELEAIQNVENVTDVEAPTTTYEAIETESPLDELSEGDEASDADDD